jgi:hypothetical protein
MDRHGGLHSMAEVSTLASPDLKKLSRRRRAFVSQYGRREDADIIVTSTLGHTRLAARASREPNHELAFAPDKSLGIDHSFPRGP